MEDITTRTQRIHVVDNTKSPNEREQEAETLFKRLVMKFLARQQIFEHEMEEIRSYNDIIDCDKFAEWLKEFPGYRDIELDDGKLGFREAVLPTQFQLGYLFRDTFDSQMNGNWRIHRYNPEPLASFQGDEGMIEKDEEMDEEDDQDVDLDDASVVSILTSKGMS